MSNWGDWELYHVILVNDEEPDGEPDETACPYCGSSRPPIVVTGMGIRATCLDCGKSASLHEFRSQSQKE